MPPAVPVGRLFFLAGRVVIPARYKPLQWVDQSASPGGWLPCPHPLRDPSALIAMQTDYTAAIIGLTALVILLTGMTVFVLSRPSDLAPRSPR